MVNNNSISTKSKLLCLLPKGYKGVGSIKINLDNLCLLLGKKLHLEFFILHIESQIGLEM